MVAVCWCMVIRGGWSRGRAQFLVFAGVVSGVLTLASAAWAQPSPRFYVDMDYVPQMGKVLVFGGQDDENIPQGAADAMWWWDPADGSWESADVVDGPSRRGGVAMAVHQPTGTVVLFGGSSGTSATSLPNTFTDTWLFRPDTGAWEKLDFGPDDRPRMGFGHAFEYHAASDLFVLFGGYSGVLDSFFNDTWHFDLSSRTWTKVDAVDPPRGRNYVGFTYDPGSEKMVLYGQPDRVRDFVVYTYDPVTQAWGHGEAELAVGGEDYYLRMVYDHDSGKIVRWGGTGSDAGTVWLYDLAADTWSSLETGESAPVRRSRHAMTAVPGVGVVVFGGSLTGTVRGRDLVNELWVLDVNAGRWEQR